MNATATLPCREVSHLRPELWRQANRALIAKAIREFAHERLLVPEALTERDAAEWNDYVLIADEAQIEYRFSARRMHLDHWHIDTQSLEKAELGVPAALEALDFILEFRHGLDIDDSTLPVYMEEVTSTLYSSAWKRAHPGPPAAELAFADFQTVEAAMTEGHPAFVANNGRIGFDADDYAAYAPEAAAPIRPVWLAAHVSRAEFAGSCTLTYETFMAAELDTTTREAFAATLRGHGLDPQDYLYLPVHPWQWRNKLAFAFAPEIVTRHLVPLGVGEDAWQAQQSIRTLFNRDHPRRCYVKMALSILNMGFTRGLSPYYMRATPAINDWVHALITNDATLAGYGFRILREVASMGYRNPHYEAATDNSSAWNKMLAALWRESPVTHIGPGERLVTMASFLHIDADGRAVLPELIDASSLATDEWLRCYLRCYMAPLLHCFYAHDLVFMPHGENLILVLEDNVPVRALMKDIGEEVGILNTRIELPADVARLAVDVPEALKVLSLFTDLFDLIFRYIAEILAAQGGFPEDAFWRCVADCVIEYQSEHPEFAEKFVRHDLFAPEFARSCVNRLQLHNNRQMIDLADPTKNLQFAGTLFNPIARFRPEPGEVDPLRRADADAQAAAP